MYIVYLRVSCIFLLFQRLCYFEESYLGTLADSVQMWSIHTSGAGGSTASVNVLSIGDAANEIGVLAQPAGDLLA